jgi:hypothetical protein
MWFGMKLPLMPSVCKSCHAVAVPAVIIKAHKAQPHFPLIACSATQLEGVRYPHDFAFGVLPVEFAKSAAPLVIYVSETPPKGETANLHRFVLARDGWSHTAIAKPEPAPEDAPAQNSEDEFDASQEEPDASQEEPHPKDVNSSDRNGDQRDSQGSETSPQGRKSNEPETDPSDGYDYIAAAQEKTEQEGLPSDKDTDSLAGKLGPDAKATVTTSFQQSASAASDPRADLQGEIVTEAGSQVTSWERREYWQSIGIAVVATICLGAAASVVYRGAFRGVQTRGYSKVPDDRRYV